MCETCKKHRPGPLAADERRRRLTVGVDPATDPPTVLIREELPPPPADPPRRINYGKVRKACELLLDALGEDPARPGLENTPIRWANWWAEFLEYDPGETETVFESYEADQLVAVRGMRVWSLCEHHLLPFFADVTIGYIPREQVLGLSKFARIAHQFAHRLQVQERLVVQIADEIQRVTGSPDVAVLVEGVHLCMTMRGIRTPATMTSSVLRGCFRSEPAARQEFLALAHSGGGGLLGRV